MVLWLVSSSVWWSQPPNSMKIVWRFSLSCSRMAMVFTAGAELVGDPVGGEGRGGDGGEGDVDVVHDRAGALKCCWNSSPRSMLLAVMRPWVRWKRLR